MTETEARVALDAAGRLPDDEIEIAAVALQLARIDAPDADWRAAGAALSGLARDAVAAAIADPAADAGDPERRRAVLAEVVHAAHGYAGDDLTYEDPANANLIRVTERRRGLPVSLGILWLHAAAAAGWAAHGVDFPGHFLVALPAAKGSVLVDVFNGGKPLEAPALRALLKRVQGESAELGPAVLRAMQRREVLLRLQNNLKLRRLQANDFAGALTCAEDMLRFAPDAAALWREAALLNHRLERIGAALARLDGFLTLVPKGEAARRMRALGEEWRARLN